MAKRTRGGSVASDMSKKKPRRTRKKYDGDVEHLVSTGSTLLDLAISGGRVRGGGIPGGILMEIFGPNSCGKTVLLCEIGGSVKRQGGELRFRDPEGRLNKQFAKLFDLDVDAIDYDQPDQVTEIFEPIKKWEPEPKGLVHGVCADSLAALTSDLEAEEKKDEYQRRAKLFSQELRKTCRKITKHNMLMACSNQVRQVMDGGPFSEKYKSPGGEAIGFYSSLRLRGFAPKKLKDEKKIRGKKVTEVDAIQTTFEVYKSTVWRPYLQAPVIISFDYGIDDVRANLQYVKDYSSNSTYTVNGESVGSSMRDAIDTVEEEDLEGDLREEVIDLWEEIRSQFKHERKRKVRWL